MAEDDAGAAVVVLAKLKPPVEAEEAAAGAEEAEGAKEKPVPDAGVEAEGAKLKLLTAGADEVAGVEEPNRPPEAAVWAEEVAGVDAPKRPPEAAGAGELPNKLPGVEAAGAGVPKRLPEEAGCAVEAAGAPPAPNREVEVLDEDAGAEDAPKREDAEAVAWAWVEAAAPKSPPAVVDPKREGLLKEKPPPEAAGVVDPNRDPGVEVRLIPPADPEDAAGAADPNKGPSSQKQSVRDNDTARDFDEKMKVRKGKGWDLEGMKAQKAKESR